MKLYPPILFYAHHFKEHSTQNILMANIINRTIRNNFLNLIINFCLFFNLSFFIERGRKRVTPLTRFQKEHMYPLTRTSIQLVLLIEFFAQVWHPSSCTTMTIFNGCKFRENSRKNFFTLIIFNDMTDTIWGHFEP